jgi:hypothetical protein
VCRAKMRGGLPRQEVGGSAIDYSKDFFGKPAYLTVSGQLQVWKTVLRDHFSGHASHVVRHGAVFWCMLLSRSSPCIGEPFEHWTGAAASPDSPEHREEPLRWFLWSAGRGLFGKTEGDV